MYKFLKNVSSQAIRLSSNAKRSYLFIPKTPS